MFQSSAVLSSHPSNLTRHRCMLLSLNSQLLLDAISVHLKFSSQALPFPSAHTAVSLWDGSQRTYPIIQNQAWVKVLGCKMNGSNPKQGDNTRVVTYVNFPLRSTLGTS